MNLSSSNNKNNYSFMEKFKTSFIDNLKYTTIIKNTLLTCVSLGSYHILNKSKFHEKKVKQPNQVKKANDIAIIFSLSLINKINIENDYNKGKNKYLETSKLKIIKFIDKTNDLQGPAAIIKYLDENSTYMPSWNNYREKNKIIETNVITETETERDKYREYLKNFFYQEYDQKHLQDKNLKINEITKHTIKQIDNYEKIYNNEKDKMHIKYYIKNIFIGSLGVTSALLLAREGYKNIATMFKKN
jgi:hypothetical protein